MLANRANDRDDRAMRDVKLTRGIMKNANGSCLVEFATRVCCALRPSKTVRRLAQRLGQRLAHGRIRHASRCGQ